jgi:hypothetical protein
VQAGGGRSEPREIRLRQMTGATVTMKTCGWLPDHVVMADLGGNELTVLTANVAAMS